MRRTTIIVAVALVVALVVALGTAVAAVRKFSFGGSRDHQHASLSGQLRIASLNDLTAEWTGGIFDATGTSFSVGIQHNISGRATILDITGWKEVRRVRGLRRLRE